MALWIKALSISQEGQGDSNDVWQVQIIGGKDGDIVETVTSRLIFYHYIERCVLTTTAKQLPKWGFEQQEVTCNPNIRDRSAVWNVEDNQFDKCMPCHLIMRRVLQLINSFIFF